MNYRSPEDTAENQYPFYLNVTAGRGRTLAEVPELARLAHPKAVSHNWLVSADEVYSSYPVHIHATEITVRLKQRLELLATAFKRTNRDPMRKLAASRTNAASIRLRRL
jgi:hypothetical protein